MKISIEFRGRELNYTELGKIVSKKFAEYCLDIVAVEKTAKLEGKSMTMILSPKS